MANNENNFDVTLYEPMTLDKMELCLNNINDAYEGFPNAYSHNNFYALFNLSEQFYTFSMEFISLSEGLFQNKLIECDKDTALIIKQNIQDLKICVDELKYDRDVWINDSTLLEDPNFAQSVENGNHYITLLKNKVTSFLKDISKQIPLNEEIAPPLKSKNHKLS